MKVNYNMLNKSKKDILNMELIEDRYFEKGNWSLKIRQSLAALFSWIILIYPILVAVNSSTSKPFWDFIFHWSFAEGRVFEHIVFSVLLKGGIGVILISTMFLIHNNYMEEHVFAKKKLYNEFQAENRTKVLNEIYTARFGKQEFRESIQYYIVASEQNLPDHLIEDEFKKKGC
ncbi:MAG: hypothetical protein FWH31_10730 [Streptococcaceae bacterium]|nr:hypothetical protein [Streptococcaceae bacterium]